MCLLKFMPPFVNEIRVVLSFCHQYSSRPIKVFSLMSVVCNPSDLANERSCFPTPHPPVNNLTFEGGGSHEVCYQGDIKNMAHN